MQPSPIIERLSKLPRGQRFVLFVLVYVLVGLMFMFMMYLPGVSEVQNLKKNKVNLKEQKSQVEARVANKEIFDSELERLTKELKMALKELPNDREIPGLLKGISTLGKKVGLEVRRFTPLPEERRDYVAEVPVELEVEGSYHEVAMFFDRLSKMNRIVYVQEIDMGRAVERGGKVSLTVSGKAVTFRFLTDDEINANKKVKGRNKGKGRAGARKGGK
jgi:type IV pilus assembly protein PilO